MADAHPILIIGGGIGGLAAAVALRRVGIPALVFEQAPALEEVGAGVSLWPNAVRALGSLGLADTVLAGHRGLERIVIFRGDGAPLITLDGGGGAGAAAVCVHRAHLQRILAEAVPADVLHLDRRLTGFDAGGGGVTARFHDGSSVRGRALIGCDGIRSVVRARLHGDGPPRARGYAIWRGAIQVELPASLEGQATEWWGPGLRFGILPGEPGRVYWYATRTVAGHGASRRAAARAVPAPDWFDGWAPPVPDLVALGARTGAVRTDAEDRHVPRQWGRGRVTLLGDAAHPMTPNMGQGACTALEDAVVLAGWLKNAGPDGDPEAALRRYERARRRRTHRIVTRSRWVGRLAQLESPAVVAARDALIRLVPSAPLRPFQRWVYGWRPTPYSSCMTPPQSAVGPTQQETP
jgi:2-polyprenyl-6-methoxyphenol hydroxylase-like FAD-dependent oxidoreductase